MGEWEFEGGGEGRDLSGRGDWIGGSWRGDEKSGGKGDRNLAEEGGMDGWRDLEVVPTRELLLQIVPLLHQTCLHAKWAASHTQALPHSLRKLQLPQVAARLYVLRDEVRKKLHPLLWLVGLLGGGA